MLSGFLKAWSHRKTSEVRVMDRRAKESETNSYDFDAIDFERIERDVDRYNGEQARSRGRSSFGHEFTV